MERERRFQVEWNRMSRNKLWRKEPGPYPTVYEDTVEEFIFGDDGMVKDSAKEPAEETIMVWPNGRDLNELSIYGQIYDFFRFMWRHTKPYKTVAMILLMSLSKPLQTTVLSFVAGKIEHNPIPSRHSQ